MNKIHQAFSLLAATGKFEPSQLHEGTDRIWITPYGNCIDYRQLGLALAICELLHLMPNLKAEPEQLELIDY